MKQRFGNVTNSSSSSFLIARNDELSEKQKERIIKAVLNLTGQKIASSIKELDKIFNDTYYGFFDENKKPKTDHYAFDKYKKCADAINKGMSIYQGEVSFEEEYDLIYVYEELFKAIVDNKDGIDIDTSLNY